MSLGYRVIETLLFAWVLLTCAHICFATNIMFHSVKPENNFSVFCSKNSRGVVLSLFTQSCRVQAWQNCQTARRLLFFWVEDYYYVGGAPLSLGQKSVLSSQKLPGAGFLCHRLLQKESILEIIFHPTVSIQEIYSM